MMNGKKKKPSDNCLFKLFLGSEGPRGAPGAQDRAEYRRTARKFLCYNAITIHFDGTFDAEVLFFSLSLSIQFYFECKF